MCDGGNSCPDGPRPTLRRRWLQLRWKTFGQIQWRMEFLTGHHAWLRRQSPHSSGPHDDKPEKSRPKGIWFWTKQYWRNYVKAYEWRLKRMTGYHHFKTRQILKDAGVRMKTELTYDG